MNSHLHPFSHLIYLIMISNFIFISNIPNYTILCNLSSFLYVILPIMNLNPPPLDYPPFIKFLYWFGEIFWPKRSCIFVKILGQLQSLILNTPTKTPQPTLPLPEKCETGQQNHLVIEICQIKHHLRLDHVLDLGWIWLSCWIWDA